jgi:hypothetical protein
LALRFCFACFAVVAEAVTFRDECGAVLRFQGLDPVLYFRESVPHLASDSEAARSAMGMAQVVDGLNRGAEMGGEIAGRQHRLEAEERVHCVHALQVRQGCRSSPRRTSWGKQKLGAAMGCAELRRVCDSPLPDWGPKNLSD